MLPKTPIRMPRRIVVCPGLTTKNHQPGKPTSRATRGAATRIAKAIFQGKKDGWMNMRTGAIAISDAIAMQRDNSSQKILGGETDDISE
jgi:hypothetical protein